MRSAATAPTARAGGEGRATGRARQQPMGRRAPALPHGASPRPSVTGASGTSIRRTVPRRLVLQRVRTARRRGFLLTWCHGPSVDFACIPADAAVVRDLRVVARCRVLRGRPCVDLDANPLTADSVNGKQRPWRPTARSGVIRIWQLRGWRRTSKSGLVRTTRPRPIRTCRGSRSRVFALPGVPPRRDSSPWRRTLGGTLSHAARMMKGGCHRVSAWSLRLARLEAG